jgi:excisionase family DNA binding protein
MAWTRPGRSDGPHAMHTAGDVGCKAYARPARHNRRLARIPFEGALVTLEELPLLLTVEEAARVMRVSRNGAYNAVAEGVIPSIRIGRTIRIPRDALAAALGLAHSMDDEAADLR